jgi:sterol desaturase/sphingolipid hydroxylase (fatty acid hydroxylase superfamily)
VSLNLSQFLDLLVMLLAIGLFTLLENRIPARPLNRTGRTGTVILIALASYGVAHFLVPLLLPAWVNLLAPLQLLDLSHLPLPLALSFTINLVALDFMAYLSHRLSHQIPLLWRLHKLHHSETQVSALTGVLHHPLELLATSLWTLGLCIITGISLWAMLAYGLLVIVHAAFVHANIRFPEKLSQQLSRFLVTPAYHRIHHSLNLSQGNSNYGEILTIWDKMLRSQKDEALSAHKHFRFGLKDIHQNRPMGLAQALEFPFSSKGGQV